jgi:hypothetical protein
MITNASIKKNPKLHPEDHSHLPIYLIVCKTNKTEGKVIAKWQG